jgi:hypothetical protein
LDQQAAARKAAGRARGCSPGSRNDWAELTTADIVDVKTNER